MPTHPATGLKGLQREFRVLAAVVGAALLACGIALAAASGARAGLQWSVQAGGLWLAVCATAWPRLALNRPDERSPLYPRLGWGNRLTLVRGGLIAATGGFLFTDPGGVGPPMLPALSYGLAALLDRLDGYCARRFGQTTLLGSELDIRFDALGLVVAPLLAVQWGRLPLAYLLLSAAFYVYRWSLQRRQDRRLPLFPLPDNPLRRILAGFQMGLVAFVLWPDIDPAFGRVAGVAFMMPVLFGFAVDWAVVTGRLGADVMRRLEHWREGYLLPALRAVLFVLGWLAFAPSVQAQGLAVSALWLCAWLMALLGLAGRVGAALLLLLLGAGLAVVSGPALADSLVLVASGLLLLGTGRYSLRPWGEDWLRRYDGA